MDRSRESWDGRRLIGKFGRASPPALPPLPVRSIEGGKWWCGLLRPPKSPIPIPRAGELGALAERLCCWEGVTGRGAIPEITSIVPSNQPRFKDEDFRCPLLTPDGGGMPPPPLLLETEDMPLFYWTRPKVALPRPLPSGLYCNGSQTLVVALVV
mmetsp:Transcript_20317/g.50540  ORF Transcript_20317/g.50540 Transcript_20317/m.50540 type:complete len:155 (+) Transcript_20317:1925-2389(+)